MPSESTDTASQQSAELDESSPLSELESEMIELFTRMAQLAGLPKSIGQIYGLIYGSPQAVNLEHVVTRLAISKGSASQGLKFLRTTGAVNIVSVEGRRSEHYVPESSLRAVVSGFLKEQIEPHLDHGVERLARLRELASESELEQKELLTERIQRLESWHKRAIGLLPFALRFLGR